MSDEYYVYLCLRRPPAPGAIPIKNVASTSDFGRKTKVECTNGEVFWAWGAVIYYGTPLTKEQIEDYELSERVFLKEGVEIA